MADAKRAHALATRAATYVPGLSPHHAQLMAEWIIANYDLGKKGWFTPMITAVAELAREHPEYDESGA